MITLHKKQEFIEVLDGYQPSDEAKELLKDIPLVVMLGVTGSGRNTIINHLVNTEKYHFIISDTTRPPKLRDGKMEQDGVNYHFRKEDELLDDLRNGMFLEAELIHDQQVSGISIRELKNAADSGKIPINEIDLGGTVSIRNAKPDAVFIFVIPPSFKEWLHRLRGREVMSEEELRNRLRTAVKVLDEGMAREDFVFIINDSSHQSADEIDEYVKNRVIVGNQSAARKIAQDIKQELFEYIAD